MVSVGDSIAEVGGGRVIPLRLIPGVEWKSFDLAKFPLVADGKFYRSSIAEGKEAVWISVAVAVFIDPNHLSILIKSGGLTGTILGRQPQDELGSVIGAIVEAILIPVVGVLIEVIRLGWVVAQEQGGDDRG
jgi:hypothetical protein